MSILNPPKRINDKKMLPEFQHMIDEMNDLIKVMQGCGIKHLDKAPEEKNAKSEYEVLI